MREAYRGGIDVLGGSGEFDPAFGFEVRVGSVMQDLIVHPSEDQLRHLNTTTLQIGYRVVNKYWRSLIPGMGRGGDVEVWYERPDKILLSELSADPEGSNEPLPGPQDCDYKTLAEATRRVVASGLPTVAMMELGIVS